MSISDAVAHTPAEVTLATCIGCGAMTLAGHCPGGCAQERKLELVPAEDLNELAVLTGRAEDHALALRSAVASLASHKGSLGTCDDEAARARATLTAHGRAEPRLRELVAAPIEPAVSWWCPRCGGVDAPQPCLGVCIRTPVRWANAERLREMRARAAALLVDTDRLVGALGLVAHTRPQPGQEDRHWRVVRRRAAAALAQDCETTSP